MDRKLNYSQELEELPLTRKHTRMLGTSGIGWALDAMDVGLISFVMAALAAHWELNATQLSWLGSIGFVGMALGATLGGLLADKFGRRQLFAATLLVYGVATGASALAGSLAVLMALRFVVGLGLGAELPVASTLISEFSPRRIRGRMVVLLEGFWAFGWIAAATIGTFVVASGDNGWRWALVLGCAPALFSLVIRLGMPESVRFLESKGRTEEARAVVESFKRSAPSSLFGKATTDGAPGAAAANADADSAHVATTDGAHGPAADSAHVATTDGAHGPAADSAHAATTDGARGPAAANALGATTADADSAPDATDDLRSANHIWDHTLRRRTAALWTVWFCINLSYYGAFIWIPSILHSQGFDLVKSFSFTLIITLAQLPGYAASAYLIEKWGRRSTLATFLVGSAVAAGLYGMASQEWHIIAAGCLLSFFNLGAWGALYAIGPELYPTHLRTTGTGAAAGFGRIASIIAPLIVPPILKLGGTPILFTVFGAAFALAAAAAFLLPELRGKKI